MNEAMGSTDHAASVRVLIADGQPRARQGLTALLTALCLSTPSDARRPFEIVGEMDIGALMVDQVQAFHPDVVVMDLYAHAESFPGPRPQGLQAIRTIKSRWPAVRIVVLTMFALDCQAALAAGADAFLLKGCSTDELLEAIMPAAC